MVSFTDLRSKVETFVVDLALLLNFWRAEVTSVSLIGVDSGWVSGWHVGIGTGLVGLSVWNNFSQYSLKTLVSTTSPPLFVDLKHLKILLSLVESLRFKMFWIISWLYRFSAIFKALWYADLAITYFDRWSLLKVCLN